MLFSLRAVLDGPSIAAAYPGASAFVPVPVPVPLSVSLVSQIVICYHDTDSLITQSIRYIVVLQFGWVISFCTLDDNYWLMI